MTDIKIDDEYVKLMGTEFSEWSEALQGYVDRYLMILNNTLTDAIISGDTAESLKEFLGYAESLKEVIKTTGQECNGLVLNYLSEVDEADSFLY